VKRYHTQALFVVRLKHNPKRQRIFYLGNGKT
jgi:hypothetical protein